MIIRIALKHFPDGSARLIAFRNQEEVAPDTDLVLSVDTDTLSVLARHHHNLNQATAQLLRDVTGRGYQVHATADEALGLTAEESQELNMRWEAHKSRHRPK